MKRPALVVVPALALMVSFVTAGGWQSGSAEALSAPSINSPAADQVVGVAGVTFSWSPVGDAGGYSLHVRDSASAAIVFSGSLLGSGSTSTLVSLPNGAYVFEVASCETNLVTCG